MQKRQWLILAVGAVIFASAIGMSVFFAGQKEAPETKKPKLVKKFVSTTSVTYEDIQTYITAFGRVETAQSIDLISEVSGRMYEGSVRLKEGQRFRKGALLFYIDDKEAALTLKSQKSNFLRDLAAILPDLKIDHPNSYSQWDAYFKAVTVDSDLPELPEAKTDKEKTFLATQGIYSTFYTIKSAEERLTKYRYYAPFDGSITAVNQESGAFVNPGTSIGTIIRTGRHELRVAVESKDIPWVQMGTSVELYSAETQQRWAGEVTRISDVVNQNTQSIDVFVSIQPGKEKIYDGQFIQAAIPARKVEQGMIIPRHAVYNANEVYVVEDTLLKIKEVFVHRTMEESVVVSGLPENADLVVEPLINAHNNMVVHKLEQKDINLEMGGSEAKPTSLGATNTSSN